MRQLVLSNCEKQFILRSFAENSRIDGRSCSDHRKMSITLGEERGSVFVVQGNSKVFVQVSCQIIEPKSGRATEGSVFVNLELSPMANPQFESGRSGDAGVEICRLLERSLKQSRCLDVESLCIVAGEQVWEIRIDVHVIDYDGSIVDAASVAAVCALRHFRRPDVTLIGSRVYVHSADEKEPIPLSMYHYPICITYGFCENNDNPIVEPTEKEELVLDGKIVVSVNSRRELCAVHCGGSSVFQKDKLLRCTSRAALRAKEMTDLMDRVFQDDIRARTSKSNIGFVNLIGSRLITSTAQVERIVQPVAIEEVKVGQSKDRSAVDKSPIVVVKKGKIARQANSKIRLPTENVDDEDDLPDVSAAQSEPSVAITLAQIQSGGDGDEARVETNQGKKKRKGKSKPDKDVQSLLDEIEDDVKVLDPAESGFKTAEGTDDPERIDLKDALRPKSKGKSKNK